MNKKILPVIMVFSMLAIMSFGFCLDDGNEVDAGTPSYGQGFWSTSTSPSNMISGTSSSSGNSTPVQVFVGQTSTYYMFVQGLVTNWSNIDSSTTPSSWNSYITASKSYVGTGTGAYSDYGILKWDFTGLEEYSGTISFIGAATQNWIGNNNTARLNIQVSDAPVTLTFSTYVYKETGNLNLGNGSVYLSSGGSTSQTTTGSNVVSMTIEAGSSITFHASADSGYVFSGWVEEGDIVGNYASTSTSYTITVPSNYDPDYDDIETKYYAVFSPRPYTLSFNANGGEVYPSSSTVYYGGYYGGGFYDPGNLPTPTLSGQVFVGWFTQANGGSQILNDMRYTTAGNSTIYAHWSLPTEYTITIYKGNWESYYLYYNHTTYTSASTTLTLPVGTEIDVDWYGYPDESGSGTDYTYVTTYDGSEFNMATTMYGTSIGDSTTVQGDMSYYPASEMTEVTTYTYMFTITYNANGGTGAPANTTDTLISTSAYNPNASRAVHLSSTVPTRSDYLFLGWSTSPSAVSPTYQPGTSYTFIFGTTNLYAVWSQTAQYTLTLEGPMLEGTTATLSASGYSPITMTSADGMNSKSVTVSPGTAVTLTASSTVTGYTFDGWVVMQNGTVIERIQQTTYSFTATDNRSFWATYEANTYTATFNANGGTPAESTKSVTYGEQYGTLPTPTYSNHVFNGWWTAQTGGTQIRATDTVTITANTTFYAHWAPLSFVVTFNANGGTPAQSYKTVTYGEQYGTLPTPTWGDREFLGWFTAQAGGTRINTNTVVTITEAQTLYAHWEGEDTVPVYWSNNLYNGSVSIAMKFNGGNNNMKHEMSIPLYSGSVENNETNWTYTGKDLKITITYPKTLVKAALIEGSTTLTTASVETGQWPSFVLEIDSDKGILSFTPINRFNDFTSFTTYSNRESVIMDWSEILKGTAIYTIAHTDSGSGAHPSFAVTSTNTFLNTYGVVMTNPSINVNNYFPDYTNVRLNFYSFALYGSSMTVNGKTFDLEDGRVTVSFVRTNDENIWSAPDTEGAMSRTFTLSNIYVTWEDGVCSLTFVNENFTVNLGSYSPTNKTVSFNGFWYFSSYLYEPYTVTETQISGDWKELPDIGGPTMILIFMGILILGGLVAHVKLGLKWLDMTVVTIAAVLAFILLG